MVDVTARAKARAEAAVRAGRLVWTALAISVDYKAFDVAKVCWGFEVSPTVAWRPIEGGDVLCAQRDLCVHGDCCASMERVRCFSRSRECYILSCLRYI